MRLKAYTEFPKTKASTRVQETSRLREANPARLKPPSTASRNVLEYGTSSRVFLFFIFIGGEVGLAACTTRNSSCPVRRL
jgi:hypothetical protein